VSQWHEVEQYCPACQAWRQTGAAATRENFDTNATIVLSGSVVLSCGHRVEPDDGQLRLGGALPTDRW
jgi:hypothetical protein